MKFIVLLFTVLLQKQIKMQGYKRNKKWFKSLLSPFNMMDMDNTGQVLVFSLLVILPSLILLALVSSLTGLLGTTLGFLIQVAVLLYVLGRDDFSQRFEAYKECWGREDYQGAYHCAQQFLSLQAKQDAGPYELHMSVRQSIVYAWFIRFFVFVFWFLVLGISGALACLLSYWFYRECKLPWVKSLLGALEWIPSRLLALSMALTGNFVSSFPLVIKFATDFQSNSKTVLFQTILSEDKTNKEEFDCSTAQQSLNDDNQLMLRCAALWLLIVACLTVFAGF